MSSRKKNTRAVGTLGEEIAARYLIRCGFEIVARNYRRSYGEVDIIARSLAKDNFLHKTLDTIHFVEVKSVSYETRSALDYAVSHETWRPEEQVHAFKVHQISKIVETWVSEQNYTGAWQIDVLTVRMVPRERYARVKLIENIILG